MMIKDGPLTCSQKYLISVVGNLTKSEYQEESEVAEQQATRYGSADSHDPILDTKI